MIGPLTFSAILFDLDGTLIDSSPSILASFRSALDRSGIVPAVPLDHGIIGPPLRQTLALLAGTQQAQVLDRLAADFKDVYDAEGYKCTKMYDGVGALLETLTGAGIPLGIATNKRRIPTMKIIEHLGWEQYFISVATLDGGAQPFANKAEMIASLLAEMGLKADSSLYIGDKLEDGEAASAQGMSFVAAGWGYGRWDADQLPKGWHLADSPADLQVLCQVFTSSGVVAAP